MALKKINPTSTSSWKELQDHYKKICKTHMNDLFTQSPERADEFTIQWDDLYIDYSKNRIDNNTMKLLLKLAEQVDLKDAINKYFTGEIINETENRAVLHTALRVPESHSVIIDGVNVVPEINKAKERIKHFSDQIIKGEVKGYSGKIFTDIVNIGIGGSDLGPKMVVDALQYYKNHLKTHFISNIDGDHVNDIIKNLNPETTLFVIVSKTFTTQETLTNANTIREWFLKYADEKAIANHFVAVSSNKEKVQEFGIDENSIFPMWNWVGGRFSLWSAVGLSISLSLGFEHFNSLLKGAHKMDEHFKKEDFNSNIPVVLALLSVWYNNFFDAETEAVIPYSQYLMTFPSFLQQGVMESNGKCVDRLGKNTNYNTGTIVWGEPGTNAQHAFFQLIHQGTKLIPVDFIGFVNPLHGDIDHHEKLISNFLAQTEALLNGLSSIEALQELKTMQLPNERIEKIIPYKVFEGNKPTNTIFIDKLTPESLGKLIAMYEHKIFVQGIIWNIYSFDQFGVELGKHLANNVLSDLKSSTNYSHDSSTTNLIKHYKNKTN